MIKQQQLITQINRNLRLTILFRTRMQIFLFFYLYTLLAIPFLDNIINMEIAQFLNRTLTGFTNTQICQAFSSSSTQSKKYKLPQQKTGNSIPKNSIFNCTSPNLSSTQNSSDNFLKVQAPFYKIKRSDTIQMNKGRIPFRMNQTYSYQISQDEKTRKRKLRNQNCQPFNFLKKNEGDQTWEKRQLISWVKRKNYERNFTKTYNNEESKKILFQKSSSVFVKNPKKFDKTFTLKDNCFKTSFLDCHNKEFQQFLKKTDLQILKNLQFIMGRSGDLSPQLKQKIKSEIMREMKAQQGKNLSRKEKQNKIVNVLKKFVPKEYIHKILVETVRQGKNFYEEFKQTKRREYFSLESSPKKHKKNFPQHFKSTVNASSLKKASRNVKLQKVCGKSKRVKKFTKNENQKQVLSLKSIQEETLNEKNKNQNQVQSSEKMNREEEGYDRLWKKPQKYYKFKKNVNFNNTCNGKFDATESDEENLGKTNGWLQKNGSAYDSKKNMRTHKLLISSKSLHTKKLISMDIDHEMKIDNKANKLQKSHKLLVLKDLQKKQDENTLKNKQKQLKQLLTSIKFLDAQDKKPKMSQQNGCELLSAEKEGDIFKRSFLDLSYPRSKEKSHRSIRSGSNLADLDRLSNELKQDEIIEDGSNILLSADAEDEIKAKKLLQHGIKQNQSRCNRLLRKKTNQTVISYWDQSETPSCKTLTPQYEEILHRLNSHKYFSQKNLNNCFVKHRVLLQRNRKEEEDAEDLQEIHKRIRQGSENEMTVYGMLERLELTSLFLKQTDSRLTVKRKLKILVSIFNKLTEAQNQQKQSLFKYISTYLNLHNITLENFKPIPVSASQEQNQIPSDQKCFPEDIQNNFRQKLNELSKSKKCEFYHLMRTYIEKTDYHSYEEQNLYNNGSLDSKHLDIMASVLCKQLDSNAQHNKSDSRLNYLGKIFSYITEREKPPFQFYHNKGMMQMIIAAKYGKNYHKCKFCFLDELGNWKCSKNIKKKQLSQERVRFMNGSADLIDEIFDEEEKVSVSDRMQGKEEYKQIKIDSISRKMIGFKENKIQSTQKEGEGLDLVQIPLKNNSVLNNYLENLF